jgi:uncharacterized membrane protein YdjX (TVP38/TMEM64 family)
MKRKGLLWFAVLEVLLCESVDSFLLGLWWGLQMTMTGSMLGSVWYSIHFMARWQKNKRKEGARGSHNALWEHSPNNLVSFH